MNGAAANTAKKFNQRRDQMVAIGSAGHYRPLGVHLQESLSLDQRRDHIDAIRSPVIWPGVRVHVPRGQLGVGVAPGECHEIFSSSVVCWFLFEDQNLTNFWHRECQRIFSSFD